MKSPILGGIAELRSTNAAENRIINLYPEISTDGKEGAYLTRCPGLNLLASVGDGPIRGAHTFGNYGYVVSGKELYRVDTDWNSTLIGTVSGTAQVSMADNGTQLFIASNPNGYIYNASTLVFGAITDADFPGAVTVGYLDGYFVFNEPDSQKVWVTSLLDGTSIDPLEFASAEGNPDNIVSLAIDHREVWLLGKNSIEVWYNSGELDFPLTRIQGAFIETGCIAPYSVANMGKGLIWLGQDARGSGTIYKTEGWNASRISTHAIEYQLSLITDISDAIGYAYQQEGHLFYVLILPSGGKTYVYDVATSLWHERAYLDVSTLTRHRSNCMMSYNGKIVVGDFENGNIYSLEKTVYDDNGDLQKWLRSWRASPTGAVPLQRQTHHSLQLDIESGTGINSGQGSDPQVMLRWSDDGGHTWSNEHWVSTGKIGQYGLRAIWRRLGTTNKSRDRIYEVSGTDPVKISIMGAELQATLGAS